MEAEVTECEMTSSFTVAMPDVLDEIDLDDLASVDDLQETISKMTKAASRLLKGTKSLLQRNRYAEYQI